MEKVTVAEEFTKEMKLRQLTEKEISMLDPYMKKIIGYRKTGLSINHVIGCPLNCGYCVRHFWGNFEDKDPQLLCTDEEAVQMLLNHKYFLPHITPLQIFNKATDPFLPSVKPHLFYFLKELDKHRLTNLMTIITRYRVTKEDVEFLESLQHLKVTLFFTYSGLADTRIEPIQASGVTVKSIETVANHKKKLKIVLYWRPIVPTWNDDPETMQKVLRIGEKCDAIAFTGYYHKEENMEYLQSLGVQVPYEGSERRKVMPLELDSKVVEQYRLSGIKTPLFRKTSCAMAYVHGLPDYNGHWGVQELCDICPISQKELCAKHHNPPSPEKFHKMLLKSPIKSESDRFLIEDGHIWTEGLGEERRYYLQHFLGYQIWDIDWAHHKFSHGRATIGNKTDLEWHNQVRERFNNQARFEDD